MELFLFTLTLSRCFTLNHWCKSLNMLNTVNQVLTSFLCHLSHAGSSSQTPKDEGRGLGQPGEILGLKRPFDVMEGGISRGLPMRDSLSTGNCEGKNSLTCYSPVTYKATSSMAKYCLQ